MSFTNQQPQIATEKDCQGNWGGGKKGSRFRCYLCGHRFIVGDTWRWIYAVKNHVINFLVCTSCDGEDVQEKWLKHVEKGEREFWWMIRDD